MVYFAEDAANTTIDILDVQAKVVVLKIGLRSQHGWNELETDVSGLSQGVYVARMKSGNLISTNKLIIY